MSAAVRVATWVAAAAAIERILIEDDGLGAVRDHRSETAPLTAAVEEYVARLNGPGLTACPDDFRDAFEAHRDAWAAAASVVARYDTLRGEMHVLFASIRALGLTHRAAPTVSSGRSGIPGRWWTRLPPASACGRQPRTRATHATRRRQRRSG